MATELWLVIALATYVIAASWGGAYYVFVANIVFSLFVQDSVSIAGLFIDPSDLMFFVLVGGFVTSRGFARSVTVRSAPHFRVWVLLGMIFSISYILNKSGWLSDPLRAGYQLYRYCWKPILFYPLAATLTADSPRRKQGVAIAIVAIGAYASFAALGSGTATEARGLFGYKNEFGGALIAPAVLGLGLLFSPRRVLAPTSVAGAYAAIWVGLLLSGSRGGFVGAAVGSTLLLSALFAFSRMRPRAMRFSVLAGALALTVLVAFPQLRSSKGAEMLGELNQGVQVGNLQWRLTERWPYFIARIKEHPWRGVGELAAHRAGKAVTPHNGYLSVAYTSGIPACVVFTGLAILATLRSRRTLRDGGLPGDERILAYTFGCAVVGILTHNLVDVTMQGGFVGQIFWVAAGVAASRHEAHRRVSVESIRPQRSVVRTTSPTIARRGRLLTPRRPVTS